MNYNMGGGVHIFLKFLNLEITIFSTLVYVKTNSFV